MINVLLGLTALIVVVFLWWNWITPRRIYIKMEMNRAWSEEEYSYWKRELGQLYLASLPFYRLFKKKNGDL